jgi:hypothetical protein
VQPFVRTGDQEVAAQLIRCGVDRGEAVYAVDAEQHIGPLCTKSGGNGGDRQPDTGRRVDPRDGHYARPGRHRTD